MSAPVRIVGFLALLAVVFGVATLAGRAASVAPRAVDDADAGHGAMGEAALPVGLSVSEDGYVLEPRSTALAPAGRSLLAFRVVAPDGTAVTDFDVEHTKRMHAILVRRDLSGFLHVHPRMATDGTWRIPVSVAGPGAYRLFADFSVEGIRRVLGVDLAAPGASVAQPLPTPASSVVVDGYRVALEVDGGRAGETTAFRFTVTRGGDVVEPDAYLGARGHLVVLREGDLAYVHAHPEESGSGPVVFESTLPSQGRYRAFLQLAVDGRVVTAPFTVEVSR